MGQDDLAVGTQHHVSTQLATVLAEVQIWSLTFGEHAGVAPNNAGLKVGARPGGTAHLEGPVGGPLFIDDEAEGAIDPPLQPREALWILETDNQHLDCGSVEAIPMLGHLHEMVFAEESPDVA
jgi:hypothetical protein